MTEGEFDAIGPWSEVKLQILKEYAKQYSIILSKYPKLKYLYIDAFADRGKHVSRKSKEIVPGSPLNALRIKPLFPEYCFIDIDPKKIETLRQIVNDELKTLDEPRPKIKFKTGDCNDILVNKILPTLTYESYRRGLCFLDPYGMHLDWEVLQMAGELRTIDVFLNFSIMDMNMNVLRHNIDNVDPREIQRMNKFWGSDTWKEVAYSGKGDLFGHPEKQRNEDVKNAFRERLNKIAGFKYVPEPIAMKNSRNAVVYYLFLASQKEAADAIANHLFRKYGG